MQVEEIRKDTSATKRAGANAEQQLIVVAEQPPSAGDEQLPIVVYDQLQIVVDEKHSINKARQPMGRWAIIKLVAREVGGKVGVITFNDTEHQYFHCRQSLVSLNHIELCANLSFRSCIMSLMALLIIFYTLRWVRQYFDIPRTPRTRCRYCHEYGVAYVTDEGSKNRESKNGKDSNGEDSNEDSNDEASKHEDSTKEEPNNEVGSSTDIQPTHDVGVKREGN